MAAEFKPGDEVMVGDHGHLVTGYAAHAGMVNLPTQIGDQPAVPIVMLDVDLYPGGGSIRLILEAQVARDMIHGMENSLIMLAEFLKKRD